MYSLSQPHATTRHTHAAGTREAHPEAASQIMTLILEGITSEDYLQWVRDPDPPDRGDLKLSAVQSAPFSDRIQLEVTSDGEMPAAKIAAHALGFPITADVVSVHTHPASAPQMSLAAPKLIEDQTGRASLEEGDAKWGPEPTPPRRNSDRSGLSVTG